MKKEDLEPYQKGLLLMLKALGERKLIGQTRLHANELAAFGLIESLSNSRYKITTKGKELFNN